MRKPSRTLLFVLAVIAAIILLLIFANYNRKTDTSTPETRLLSGNEITTTPTSQSVYVTPTMIMATIPAPKSGMPQNQDTDTYFGGYIGDLTVQNEHVLKVYAPAYDMNGTLLLPKDGLVLWAGHFIGHLIQPHGWLIIEQGNTIKWVPFHGSAVEMQVQYSEELPGFVNGLSALPPNTFDLVTCYIDFKQSTPQQRIFGGNLIYKLITLSR